ncbi:MAG: hypothetical protein LBQ58_09905 [Synergistaceae bacterium]|jgi:hypothetical protein|nr:hypothetical protein [Synergistaceae bacterium]
MKKIFLIVLAVSLILCSCSTLAAWDAEGAVPQTDIEFSSLEVSKGGVRVRLTNKSDYNVKVSLRLAFTDSEGNGIGYSIFGLREIPAGSYVDISNNYLNGNWKKCRDAHRMIWQKMTYEPIYR